MNVPLVSTIAKIWNDALVQISVAYCVLLLLREHLTVLGMISITRVLHVSRLVQDVVLKLQRRVVTRDVMRAMSLFCRTMARVLD